LLEETNDQEIIFYTDLEGDGTTDRVRYTLSGTNLLLGVTKPSGTPIQYLATDEKVSTVASNIRNGATPLFYYYNGTYTGKESALTQPVNVTEVKTVKLDLRIFNKAGVTNSSYYTVVTHGVIRSLKTNLGE
jgi:hypothetical protein